jgi:hypothetical protein
MQLEFNVQLWLLGKLQQLSASSKMMMMLMISVLAPCKSVGIRQRFGQTLLPPSSGLKSLQNVDTYLQTYTAPKPRSLYHRRENLKSHIIIMTLKPGDQDKTIFNFMEP